MSEEIAKMFEANGRAFSRRDYDRVMSDFQLPNQIYAENRVLHLRSVDAMQDVVCAYREKLAVEGVARVEKRIISFGVQSTGATAVTLTNAYFAADESYLGTSMARHWCRSGVDGPSIELTEYLQLPLGLGVEDFPFLRQAA